MRLACIADIHGQLPESIPHADAVIIAGDICPDGPNLKPSDTQREFLRYTFPEWCEQASSPVLATWGNHDFTQTINREEVEEFWPHNLSVYVDTATVLNGVKFWFSPWVINLPQWAWNTNEILLRQKLSDAPLNTDILVSHAPPFRICDKVITGDSVGSEALAGVLPYFTHNLVVICGHIHEARGHMRRGDQKIYNVASIDERFQPYPNRWTIVEV